jgi:hypothetical protein
MWYLDVCQRVWWLVEVVLMLQQLKRRFLPLLLSAEDPDGVLELCESSSFFVDVLPSGFGTLGFCLSPCEGFLFLMEPI